MLEKLHELRRQVRLLEEQLSDADLAGQPQQLADLARRHAELSPIVRAFDEYETLLQTIVEAEELAAACDDVEERAFYEEQKEIASAGVADLANELRRLLMPKDPNAGRNVILEIRAAAGGDESGLFVADLARMYARYAERQGWEAEVLSSSPTGIGGFKEVTLGVRGKIVWSRLKYEGGTHRVQRVPETETSGRIHTSTVTVAVLPEPDIVEVRIDENDLKIDRYRSSGPGGQSVNTTDSAVRVTHVPTGIVVQCQDQKSQLQNRERALRHLRALLLQKEEDERHAEIAADRRAQVGSGERSGKIRTYNYPQNRVTDHRVGVTAHDLQGILDGGLVLFVDALAAEEETRRLADAGVTDDNVRDNAGKRAPGGRVSRV